MYFISFRENFNSSFRFRNLKSIKNIYVDFIIGQIGSLRLLSPSISSQNNKLFIVLNIFTYDPFH